MHMHVKEGVGVKERGWYGRKEDQVQPVGLRNAIELQLKCNHASQHPAPNAVGPVLPSHTSPVPPRARGNKMRLGPVMRSLVATVSITLLPTTEGLP